MAVWIRVGYKPMVILVKKSAIQNEGRKKVYIPEIKPKLGVKAQISPSRVSHIFKEHVSLGTWLTAQVLESDILSTVFNDVNYQLCYPE